MWHDNRYEHANEIEKSSLTFFRRGGGGGGGKGKGGKFVLCDAKLVGQSMENYFQPPLV